MPRRLMLVLLICALNVAAGQAQTNSPRAECPPGAGANAPSIGRESKGNLSDQLADSKGVICPPAGVDPGMQQRPAEGGTLKVIPPPGSPGGNPSVQPK